MGVPLDAVTAELPVSLDRLRSTRSRIDWDTFALFMDKVGERIGPEGIEQLGMMIVDAPTYRRVGLVAGSFVSARHVIHLVDRFLGPAIFPSLLHRLEELPDGRMRLVVEVPAGHRVSEAFYLSMAANLRVVPVLFGLPEAHVEMVIDGPRATYTLLLPEEHLAQRLKRAASVLLRPRGFWANYAKRQRTLEDSYNALSRFRRDFHTVIERLPDGVAILRGGLVAYANRAVVQGLGYERRDELIGRPIASFLPEEEQERMAHVLERYEGRPPAGEVSVVRKDGRQVVFDVLPVQMIDFEGKPANLVVIRDVTDRKRLQQQLMLADRMASLGTLAAGVAHEVNNPLAYTHISLHTLARELGHLGESEASSPHIDAMREALAAAQHGIDRVRTIVGDLKTFSRPDDETIEPVDVHRVLESAISMAAKELRHRTQLVRDYDDIPPVLANDARLGQVFLNLLVNASQALPEERRSSNLIRLRTRCGPEEMVTIEVADNGSGIPTEILEHVFVPFVTTKPSSVGTGLGLSICHRIITRLGGQIEVESSPDRGTTVRVTLPAAAQVQSSRPEPLSASNEAERRARVLIVDDEPVLLDTLQSLLESSHEVVTAESGRRALEVLETDPQFDVILCDLMMSEFTGMDVYEGVQNVQPGLEERIIFMTGGAFTNATRRFLAQVDNPCLDKPFTVEEVFDLIRSQMARDTQP